MAQRVNPANSQYKDYLPACVKCKNYRAAENLDPFDEKAQCEHFGNIPVEYLLMSHACKKLYVDRNKAFINVGDRPLTMLERMATDY